jgi:flavin-dependent dehydrogenase
MRDLIVAGGGPIGLATALHAHRAGLDVVVREPREGPIDKACGEGLMPPAVSSLAQLGVRPVGHLLRGIRYVDGPTHVEADFREGPGLGVRRLTLHAGLLAAVGNAGICIEHRPVRQVAPRAGAVEVDSELTRYLIAADGLHSPVRRMLGLERPSSHPRRFGQRCHVEVPPWTSYVEVHWAARTEAYVTPVTDGQIGVALLSDRRASYDELLGDFPELAARLAGYPRSRVMGAGPLYQRAARPVEGRVLLVGDASGYVDALTGEGVAVGLDQARAAVAAVARDRPGDYLAGWRRATRRRDLLTQGLLAASRRPAVRRRLVPAAAALPRVFGVAVNQLAAP